MLGANQAAWGEMSDFGLGVRLQPTYTKVIFI